ncbi:exodeoxyribonuclease V subunit beta [Halochromatium sp.]|uniref:exodeoxyribonuclease V subunit beta n=1 Tax=Halochromatium sp. TaxID=2049430 RepID=UPI00397E89F0
MADATQPRLKARQPQRKATDSASRDRPRAPVPAAGQPDPASCRAQIEPNLDALRFPLRGSRLIEASAGTGKTYTLALLYIRLVLGHGQREGEVAPEAVTAFHRPLMPPNILVVTFTEAATKELRERIRARLVDAAECFEAGGKEGTDGGPDAATGAGTEIGAEIGAGRKAAPKSGTAARTERGDALQGEEGAHGGVDTDDPLLRLRRDYPAQDWPRCARLLQQAAAWMDEAMIATIHGWCQRMLQEHAFATRGLFEPELVTDQTDLLLETLRDYWRLHFYALEPEDARSLREVAVSPEALHRLLSAWLSQREAPFSFQGQPLASDRLAEALRARRAYHERLRAVCALEDAAREAWKKDRHRIETKLKALRPALNGTYHASANEAKFADFLEQAARWSEGGEAPTPLKHFAQGAFVFKAKAAVQEQPDHPVFEAIASWRQAADDLGAADNADAPSLEACLLAHAAAWLGRELPRRLRQRAEMGFDELLRDLEAALNPAESNADACAQAKALAATIRRQFPVALIDEFQDTDPIQYRIFDAVYGVAENRQDSALILIGDPKQSIYGFRGADIHAYLAARAATAGRHHSLTVNYRSTSALVAACNRFFGQAERHERGAFRFRPAPEADNPIPYVRVSAKDRGTRLIVDRAPASAMTFWSLGEAAIGTDDYRQQMAEVAATAVRDWLDQARARRTGLQGPNGFRPLKPRDIAILVKDRKEAEPMRRALAARGIHSVYLSDRDSVFDTREAADLLHWLRACAAPSDERLVRAALGTNTLGLPLAALARLQQDELGWEQRVERFAEYHRLWQRRGVLAMLHQFMHDEALPARLLARDGGERILTNLLHLAEWLQQSASALDGEQALIRHLAEHLGAGGEEFVVRLESDAELIQVATIHKSKGLQYPLVLLPFICGWREIDGHTRQVSYRPPPVAAEPGAEVPAASAAQVPAALATQVPAALAAQVPAEAPVEASVGLAASAASKRPSRYLEVAGHRQFPQAWDAADDDRLSEEMRLLYVAVTRAEHAVWLGMAPLKRGNAKSPQLHKSAIGYVLTGGKPLADAEALWAVLDRLCGPEEGADPGTAAVPAATGAAARGASGERAGKTTEGAPVAAAAESAPEAAPGAAPEAVPESAPDANGEVDAGHLTHDAVMVRRPAPAPSSDRLAPAEASSLAAARRPGHQGFARWWIASYSALRRGAPEDQRETLEASTAETARQETALEESVPLQEPPLSVPHEDWPTPPAPPAASALAALHAFPRGSRYGTFLHGLLEWAAAQESHEGGQRRRGFAAAASTARLRRDMLARRCTLRGLGDWRERLEAWLTAFLTRRWTLTGLDDGSGQPPSLALCELRPSQMQVELEFWLPSRDVDSRGLDRLLRAHCLPQQPRPELPPNRLDGLLKGFIDLVFEHQGRYYVLDWKSNWLGADDSAYTPEAMRAAILGHRYDLQYAFYLLALHRQLRARLPDYDYDRHLGGAVYVFLRGSGAPSQGLFTDKPPQVLIEALDRCFAGQDANTPAEVHG